MDNLDYPALCRTANEWKKLASDLDFLGEIALSQPELDGLLISIGRFHRRVDEPLLAFVLSVAAVNWAFWRGVDEEESRSFIKSFMQHSVGYNDSKEWDSVWGPAIETTICQWSKQQPRVGAYRYVGLILRHAGVPYAKIPKFAALLKELDRDIGWANIPSTRDSRIRDQIATYFGTGIVGEHLSSEAGLAYLRSLCADLMLLRSRDSHTPSDLPGYRPGLLSALLEHLSLGARVPLPPSFPMPYVVFGAVDGRLELVFDERLIRRKEQIYCEQIGGRLFDSRLDLGPGGVEPSSTFSGRFPDGRPWAIKGWKYTEPNAWALFRVDGRLVTTHSHSDPVAVGEYLLATVSNDDQTARWDHAVEEGERQLPDGTDCRLWHLDLNEGDNNKLPNLQITTLTQPWIACVNGEVLSRWSEVDSVCSLVPVIEVGGWSGRNSRRFRLQMAIGSDERDLHPTLSERGTSHITLTGLPVGIVAEIRLIPVGFQNGPRATQILKVVRFPGEMSIPSQLWPLNENAILNVTLSDGLHLAAPDSVEINKDRSHWLVVLPPHLHVALLILTRDDTSLNLRIPVRRCSFSLSNAPTQGAFFDHAFLKQMCDASVPFSGFTVHAIPGCSFDLLVRDKQGDIRLWRRGLRLGSNGRLELAATEIVDVARQESGILEVVVECYGFSRVRTGAYFVQPELEDIDTRSLPLAVELYLRILKQPLDLHETLDAVCDAPCLYSRVMLVAMIDCSMGLSAVQFKWSASVEAMVWVSEIRSLLADTPKVPGSLATNWKNRLVQWLRISPLPFTPLRWAAFVNARIAEVDRTIDVAGPLRRLIAGQHDPSVPQGLAHGWHRYLEPTTTDSSRDAKLLQANDFLQAAGRGNPPWSEIAGRLSAWTMLRAGAIQAFVESFRNLSESWDCAGLDADLTAVARILGMTGVSIGPQIPGGLELSTRQDDRLLAAALWGEVGCWTKAAHTDWLSAWLAWRWSIIMGLAAEQRSHFKATARGQIDAVPFRARDIVTDELQSDAPRVF